MATSKNIKWIAIIGGIAAAIGLVAIIHTISRAAGRKLDHSNDNSGQKAKALQGASSSFPLKNGSPKNDLVKQLQGYLGVTADGLFGPKTQAALLLKTGKTSIASQAEFDQVIGKLSAAAQTGADSTRADKLVNDWKSNGALKLIATSSADAYQILEDAYGALTTTGKNIKLLPGYMYNRSDYVLLGSTQQGYVKFQVMNGAGKGLYKVDPNKISVA